MAKSLTDTAKAVKQASDDYQVAVERKKVLLAHYRKEPMVPMYLSPMYQPFVGRVMNVSLNGISIFFAVDGRVQMVPQSFAEIIGERRIAIDNMIAKTSQMADIRSNFENAPGELKLF